MIPAAERARPAGRLRRTLAGAALGMGLVPVALLAVPTALLIGLMCLFWTAADRLVRVLERPHGSADSTRLRRTDGVNLSQRCVVRGSGLCYNGENEPERRSG